MKKGQIVFSALVIILAASGFLGMLASLAMPDLSLKAFITFFVGAVVTTIAVGLWIKVLPKEVDNNIYPVMVTAMSILPAIVSAAGFIIGSIKILSTFNTFNLGGWNNLMIGLFFGTMAYFGFRAGLKNAK